MIITNLQIVLPDELLEHGALYLHNGKFAAIYTSQPKPSSGETVIDGTGLIALPGIVDLHGDMIEKEIETRPGVFFPTPMAIYELDKRLAACGVTTAYAALSLWDIDRPEGVRGRALVREMIMTLNRLHQTLLVDQRIHARFEVSTPSSTDLMLEMLELHQLHMVSLMDHTPGQGQYRDVDRYIDYLAKHRQADREIVEREAHERIKRALDAAEINWQHARQVAEVTVAQRLPIASHDDDTPAKIAMVADLGVTISEFPVTLEAAHEARRRGMHVVMGAPNVLRGSSHSGNLSAQEAIMHGLVDTLAADYAPAALLHAVFKLVERGILSLTEATKLVTLNPADALGLTDRGQINLGLNADLVLVEAHPHLRVRATFRNGKPIYWDNTMHERTKA
jgi:alpha-D-ribose 1-methylphosphonate 5-triphosphate diphosphatase